MNLKKIIRKLIFPSSDKELSFINHYGNRLLVNKNTYGFKLKLGLFEKNELSFLDKFIRKDDICLDIGANIGVYSLFFSKRSKKTFCFEPIKINNIIIELNAELNKVKNIKIERIAISDTSGNCDFLVVDESILSGILSTQYIKQKAYLKRYYDTDVKETIRVKCNTIDSFNYDKVDIVKIDVEGAELKVINGAVKTIKKCMPRLIMMECYDQALNLYGNNLKELLNKMEELNYCPFYVYKGKLNKFNINSNKKFENLFFLPDNNFNY